MISLRLFWTVVCMSWALVLTASTARASTFEVEAEAEVPPASAPVSDAPTRIWLITIGPGDDLYTRGGHAALMVEWTQEGTYHELVYDFGEADWDSSTLAWDFLMGQLTFRLEQRGDLFNFAGTHGVSQNRDVFKQELALSHSQAEAVHARLKELDVDEKRHYAHDYVRAICTTKARDIIDEAVGGVIHDQLSAQNDELTIREHQRRAFYSKPLAGLGADLLLGAENDQPLSRYDALFVPWRMRMYLQEVTLESPTGPVPLAGPPIPVAGRTGVKPRDGATRGSLYFAVPLIGWLLWGAGKLRSRFTLGALGEFALWPSLLFAVIGCALWGLHLLTDETGFQNNPLALAFVPVDFVLAFACTRFKRGEGAWLPAARRYAVGRGLMAAAVLARNLSAEGATPIALPIVAVVFFALFAWQARVRDAPRAS